MFEVWTSIKVTNPDHPRFQTAGTVNAQAKAGEQVQVKFDLDGEVIDMDATDLQALR